MIDYAQLNDIAADRIEKLIAEGITPTPSDVVRLNCLGWQINKPEIRTALSKGVPVEVGGATLWPLTMQAGDWYHRIGCRLHLDALALAYAMAHCYEDGKPFAENRARAAIRVASWAARLKCRMGTIVEAVSQILQQDEGPDQPPDPNGNPPSVGEMSARLAATCGGTPDYWEAQCSYQYALDVLHCVMAQANESDKPLPSDPAIKATRALAWAVQKIKDRHNV